MWLIARMLADEALHIARILATCNRLLSKVVQVEDNAEYEMDSIICHLGCPHHCSTSFNRRGMVEKRTCGS